MIVSSTRAKIEKKNAHKLTRKNLGGKTRAKEAASLGEAQCLLCVLGKERAEVATMNCDANVATRALSRTFLSHLSCMRTIPQRMRDYFCSLSFLFLLIIFLGSISASGHLGLRAQKVLINAPLRMRQCTLGMTEWELISVPGDVLNVIRMYSLFVWMFLPCETGCHCVPLGI